MEGYIFTWDPVKEASNWKKHGVSIQEAISVFNDDYARLLYDPLHSEMEDRFILLGLNHDLKLLAVSHCYREEVNEIRLISARWAKSAEQLEYERFRYEKTEKKY